MTLTLVENGDVLCKHCKQPVEKEDRKYRGSTFWRHTNGRIFCGGPYTMMKAEPEEGDVSKEHRCSVCGAIWRQQSGSTPAVHCLGGDSNDG